MKKKKFNLKKIIFVVSLIIIIVLVLLLFEKLLGNDDKILFDIGTSKRSAKEISELYSDNYNKPTILKGSIINKSGTYELNGNYECVRINTKMNVNLILNNANIVCDSGPGIYVENAKTLHVILKGGNNIISKTNVDLEGAIYSKDDLVFSGDGSLNINSNYEGIVSNDNLVIKSGNYYIKSLDDGIKGKDVVAIVDGYFKIDSNGDGIKSTNSQNNGKGYITINNGTFDINSVLDGLQAETDVVINNGTFKIKTSNTTEESSKAIKANNLIEINNGTFDINSSDDGLNTDGNMKIDSGNFNIISGDEGVNVAGLFINKGNISINSKDGIKSSYFKMDSGTIAILAKDEGITTVKKIKKYNSTFEMNGGNIVVRMGAGSSAGIACPGNFIVHNGIIDVSGDLPFELTGTVTGDGGTIISNGRNIENISSLAPRKKSGNNNNKQNDSTVNSSSQNSDSNRESKRNRSEQKKDQ